MPGSLKLLTESGGSLTIAPTDTGSSYTMSLPSSSDTITTNTATQILSNKTLNTPTISSSSGEIARIQGGTSSAGFVRFADNTNTNIGYVGRNNTSDIYLWQSTANSIIFGTNNLQCGRFDSSGRFTIPNQPAFDAVPPANYTLNGGDQIIAGTWSEMTDRNNNFNPANGTFTAPVAGFYHFTWSSFVTSTSTRNDAYISVNGSIRARSEISGYAAGTTNRSSMVSVSTYLAANDNVTVGIYIAGTGNTYAPQSPWGRFSGFLVG